MGAGRGSARAQAGGGRPITATKKRTPVSLSWRLASSSGLLYQAGDVGNDVLVVADDAEVGGLEDRGIRVLVDRDNGAGPLQPNCVIELAGDGDGEIETRSDGAAREPNLKGTGKDAFPNAGQSGAQGPAKGLRQVLHHPHVLFIAEACAYANHG